MINAFVATVSCLRMKTRRSLVIGLVLVTMAAGAVHGRIVPQLPGRIVTLHALDKITGHVRKLEVPRDQPVQFETLTITVRECRFTAPEDEAEAAAFIEVVDQGPGADPQQKAFSGWMFASSPSLSALEHPIYDLWVTECKS